MKALIPTLLLLLPACGAAPGHATTESGCVTYSGAWNAYALGGGWTRISVSCDGSFSTRMSDEGGYLAAGTVDPDGKLDVTLSQGTAYAPPCMQSAPVSGSGSCVSPLYCTVLLDCGDSSTINFILSRQ